MVLSRFLLTKSVLPLKQYDPFNASRGPWRIQDGVHYVQKEYPNPDSWWPYRLDMEYMLGGQISFFYTWLCVDLSEDILGSLKDTWTIGVRWPFRRSRCTVGNMYFCKTKQKVFVRGLAPDVIFVTGITSSASVK